MDTRTIKRCIQDEYEITEQRVTETRKQLILKNEAVVSVFNNGNYIIQGKNSDQVKEYIENNKEKYIKSDNNKVFIVYGHNENVRIELENILKEWELEPIVLDKVASEGKTIIEKLESQMLEAAYGIVLATADDEGNEIGFPTKKKYRCRQNVVMELGMLLSKLERDKVAILVQNYDEMELPSDINGVVHIPFKDKLGSEVINKLAKELDKKIGIAITASK